MQENKLRSKIFFSHNFASKFSKNKNVPLITYLRQITLPSKAVEIWLFSLCVFVSDSPQSLHTDTQQDTYELVCFPYNILFHCKFNFQTNFSFSRNYRFILTTFTFLLKRDIHPGMPEHLCAFQHLCVFHSKDFLLEMPKKQTHKQKKTPLVSTEKFPSSESEPPTTCVWLEFAQCCMVHAWAFESETLQGRECHFFLVHLPVLCTGILLSELLQLQ